MHHVDSLKMDEAFRASLTPPFVVSLRRHGNEDEFCLDQPASSNLQLMGVYNSTMHVLWDVIKGEDVDRLCSG